MMCAQAPQCRNHILLTHLHRVGDHTRGLFEAEASIAISTTHALEDVKILFLVSHCAHSLMIHDLTPENPTFCVVINSVLVCGVPSGFTATRIRVKMRHGPPRQTT